VENLGQFGPSGFVQFQGRPLQATRRRSRREIFPATRGMQIAHGVETSLVENLEGDAKGPVLNQLLAMAAVGAPGLGAFDSSDSTEPRMHDAKLRLGQELLTRVDRVRMLDEQRSRLFRSTQRGAGHVKPKRGEAFGERIGHFFAEPQLSFVYDAATRSAFRASTRRGQEDVGHGSDVPGEVELRAKVETDRVAVDLLQVELAVGGVFELLRLGEEQ
jgi:hypothetical protein